MKLIDLLNSVATIQVIGEVQRKDISGIFYNSNKVIANSVFVAIKGYKTDGHRFIMDAINNGAISIIMEDNDFLPDEIFIHRQISKVLVKDSRKAMASMANLYYEEASKKLDLVGITGTNGKTTTTFYIKSILENAGKKTGLIGTIANYIGDVKKESSMTTPESNELNEMLLDMHSAGCTNAVMEVSSHSLFLNRTYRLNFQQAIFSNLTSDHLDFHETTENYLKAKKILFDDLSETAYAIVNSDDASSKLIVEDCKAKVVTYGKKEDSDFRISDINFDLTGTTYKLTYSGKTYEVKTSLIGEFNAYNSTAAIASAVLAGIEIEKAIEGILLTKQVPGRMEVVGNYSKKVIVDYSHTADSLEKSLEAIINVAKENKNIYAVFGCGGNRDKGKRPIMGKIGTKLSKKAFITSDNPRLEDPNKIIEDILTGIETDNYVVLPDREEAIKTAIETTEDNAIILIAGKGHEDYQDINGVKRHFSDYEIAEKYLSK